MNYWLLIS